MDPELLKETLDLLRAGRISPVAYVPDDAELARLEDRLLDARVTGRCECGQENCRTYYFQVPEKPHSVSTYTVRFYARGEAMLHIDSEGDIYKLQRLDEAADAGPRTVYAKRRDGSWESRVL